MRKLLLFMVVFFTSLASFAQGEGELASNDITILKGIGYRMYIKSYSDLAIQKTNEGKKFAVAYVSSDSTIVKPEGNIFRGLANGSCTLTLKLSTAYEGTLDMFDPENIVMEKTFNVNVSEEDKFVMPAFELTWGLSRQDAINNQKVWNHEHITDKYFEHAPNVVEHNPELVKQIEVFYNDNFEAPITIDQFTEEGDQLVASTILIAAWERLTTTDEYIHAWLQEQGFVKSTPTPPYWNMTLTKDGYITAASWESVILDNVWYASLMMHYDGIDEAGIDDVNDEFSKFDVYTNDKTIKINAHQYVGKKVILSDISGKLISSDIVMSNGNVFNVPTHGMYIIKIEGVKSVKVVL